MKKPLNQLARTIKLSEPASFFCLRTTADWGEFPARATVGAELKAEALVEVSVVAYKD